MLFYDKSEALIVGTSYQLRQVSPAVPSVNVAGVDLPDLLLSR